MKFAIIYLHGFNSASLDHSGNLLSSKQKLVVMDQFCRKNNIQFCSPNVDYRNFEQLVNELSSLFNDLEGEGADVIFMGSSLGGFTSEYMAMKMSRKAIMINPAISPSELLVQFIGVTENYELGLPYTWTKKNCEQYKRYESELAQYPVSKLNRTLLLDMADELIDSSITVNKYQDNAQVLTFDGGSHGFEHIVQALPAIERVIFS